jgi:hypothetical protein
MKTTPVLYVQGIPPDSEKTDLQEKIENMHFELLEREDVINLLKTTAERLKRDLKTEVGNRDHFRQLIAQQDAFIEEAKRQIEEYKIKQEAELKAKTTEAEHLAKQAIRLNEENSKLLTEHADIMSHNNQLDGQMPLLMDENNKFREQTTRLIEENRKLQDKLNNLTCEGFRSGRADSYCGECLECHSMQAEHALGEAASALRFERSIASYKDTIISTLRKALNTLNSMTCLSWRKQAKTYRDCVNTVAATQGNIDNLREQQKKGMPVGGHQ